VRNGRIFVENFSAGYGGIFLWMLSESQTYLMTAPWGSVFPGLAVILLALGVSLLGDGLQKKGGN